MSQPYIAQVMLFAFNFAPRNWAFCNGALMPISQNQALFSLVGTTYGGDGRVTFGLPNIHDSSVMSIGQGPGLSNYVLGENSGVSQVALTQTQMPAHTHTVYAGGTPSQSNIVATPPQDGWIANHDVGPVTDVLFAPAPGGQTFASQVISIGGGSQPHENEQPYLGMNYCIALFGIFPSRN